jgi:hypothetical protein
MPTPAPPRPGDSLAHRSAFGRMGAWAHGCVGARVHSNDTVRRFYLSSRNFHRALQACCKGCPRLRIRTGASLAMVCPAGGKHVTCLHLRAIVARALLIRTNRDRRGVHACHVGQDATLPTDHEPGTEVVTFIFIEPDGGGQHSMAFIMDNCLTAPQLQDHSWTISGVEKVLAFPTPRIQSHATTSCAGWRHGSQNFRLHDGQGHGGQPWLKTID